MAENLDFLAQYGQVGTFMVFGLFFAFASIFAAWLFRARGNDPEFRTTYECGSEPVGPVWIGLNVRFYLFALIFVLFDVETLFIIPWAVAYRGLGMKGFIEMVVFIGVLFVGLVYAWRKGALKWE